MPKFSTGYIVSTSEIKSEEVVGKNFRIIFRESLNGKEVVVDAKSYTTAKKVSKLIHASLTLLYSHPLTYSPPAIREKDNDFVEEGEIRFYSCSEIVKACEIACYASFKRKHYYSLFKYHLACDLHSNYVIDLDPRSSIYHRLSPFPDDHIRMGYSIVIFYSVLEELGAEIRASAKNPSKLADGSWNPVVKNDLEKRLKKLGINIERKIYWELRSTPTKIERKKKLSINNKVEWAYGYVRDLEIPLIEAISIISWIRSCIVAHKVKDMIGSISIYNVSNANHLSRIILLESMGFLKDLFT